MGEAETGEHMALARCLERLQRPAIVQKDFSGLPWLLFTESRLAMPLIEGRRS